jgi:hypothetical protein
MIEWRWGLEPLRLRDRRAKNLAAALDFATRRDPIDLPAVAPPPPTACPEGGGWTDLPVSPSGALEASVEVEQTDGAYHGRLLRRGQELAAAAGHPVAGTARIVLDMKVTKAVLSMIAANSNRLPALLEVTSRKTGGSICRSTSPVLLRLRPRP